MGDPLHEAKPTPHDWGRFKLLWPTSSLRRMQSLIPCNDLLCAITIGSLCCNVLKVHFGYLLHPLADGTAQSCLLLCLEVCASFFNYVKAN